MHLQLITLNGISVDQDIYELIAPTAAGEIGIFPGHEPLVTLAVPGALTVRHDKKDRDDKLEYFAISGGVIEINPDSIRVLVDEADHGENIIEAESRAALERAMKLRDEAKDQVELEKATQLIDRHAVRLQVADLHRRRRRQ
ncbi:MAG: ATP synthase F1 subunit epsilon [Candidatus Microsaccharimonas sp.]|jgi:F-type H+-transporting ATPase subunit epsilon